MASPTVSHKQAAVLSGARAPEGGGGKSAVELLRDEAARQGFLGSEDAPLDLTTKAGQVRFVCAALKKGDATDRDTIGYLKHLADLAGISGARGDLRRESDKEVVEELLALSPIVEMAFKIRLTDKGPVVKPRRGRPPKPRFVDPTAKPKTVYGEEFTGRTWARREGEEVTS